MRSRDFAPKFTDVEVMTIEIVGEFVELSNDKKIWEYFKRHWFHWFSQLPDRTTFVRQAANLWQVKQMIQKKSAIDLGAFSDPLHIIDGFPIPVCHFVRARRGKLFKGEARYGRCVSKKEVYYGFKGHMVTTRSGVISSLMITPAHIGEHEPVEELLKGMQGLVVGDKGFISSHLKTKLKALNIALEPPLKKNMKDKTDPAFLLKIKSVRRLIETVIGQLNECFNYSEVWASDLWHLLSRLASKLWLILWAYFLTKN